MTRWTARDIGDQSGKTVLVTGANGGLGLRTAEALAAAGATVVMACRNLETAEQARKQIAAVRSGGEPIIVPLDLADLGSVRKCAEEVKASFGSLDVLINNAGLMAVPYARTADGFEMQFGTNHLGHFALTGLLLDSLHRSPAPRVVTVSSIAHWAGVINWRDLNWERRYFRWPAYAQSKLANLLFTSELDRRARDARSSLVAIAAHPGISDTNLYDGPQDGRNPIATVMGRIGRALGQPDSLGALPQLRAATDPDAEGNDFFGAGPLPGPLALRGHPRPAVRSLAARRASSAGRLWKLSEELTDVEYAWP